MLRLGCAAYSFRDYFSTMKGKPNSKLKAAPSGEPFEIVDFIAWCAENGVGGAELTSYFFPAEKAADYAAECRRVAHLAGVEISGTAVGNNFSYPAGSPERAEQIQYVKEWINYASIMGAPHIRVFAGKHPKGVSEDEAEANAASALEEMGAYAGESGIFLGIENHDSISDAGRLLRIVKAANSPWVGANVDTGNFHTEDIYKDLEETLPYAVNVQVKTQIHNPNGEGKIAIDMDRVGKLLKDSGYRGYVVLEYEEDGDPFEEVPKVLDVMRGFCDA